MSFLSSGAFKQVLSLRYQPALGVWRHLKRNSFFSFKKKFSLYQKKLAHQSAFSCWKRQCLELLANQNVHEPTSFQLGHLQFGPHPTKRWLHCLCRSFEGPALRKYNLWLWFLLIIKKQLRGTPTNTIGLLNNPPQFRAFCFVYLNLEFPLIMQGYLVLKNVSEKHFF